MVEIRYNRLNQNMHDGSVTVYDYELSSAGPQLLYNNELPNYVTFDGNGIDLDNRNTKFYNGSDYLGYISATVSAPLSGDREGNEIRYSAISFNRNYSFLNFDGGMTICFYGDCCREFEARYTFPDTHNEYEIVSVDSEIFHWYPRYSEEIYQLDIIFTKTTLPYQFIKVAYIKFGEELIFNKFKNIELLEEINVLSDDLPINSLDYSVVSNEPLDFQSNDPMNVYSNGKYYGTFYLDDAQRTSKDIYSIKAYNLIDTLENTEFINWKSTTVKVNDFLQEINSITNISIKSDVDLDKYSVFGHIPINTFRYALCGVAFACCLMIDTSRGDKIGLVTIPSTISSIITTQNKRIIGDATYSKKRAVTSANYVYPEGFSTQPIELYPNNTADEGMRYIFDEPPIEIEFIQGNSDRLGQSLNHIDFKAENDNVTLSGWKISFGNRTSTIYNPDFIFDSKAKNNELEFKHFNLRGGIANDEGLITSLVEKKSDDILKFIQSTGTIKAKIRLRGEKVGDLIQIETAFDGFKTGIITSMNVHFGYEDTADIEVLEWPNG